MVLFSTCMSSFQLPTKGMRRDDLMKVVENYENMGMSQ